MAVTLNQIRKSGSLSSDKSHVAGGPTQLPYYEDDLTGTSLAIGAAVQLNAATTAIEIGETTSAAFRWALVDAEGATVPATALIFAGSGRTTWAVPPSTRWFKTLALA